MDAYTAYTEQAATTASPAQLVLMLYDGALARVDAARNALQRTPVDVGAAHTALTKAQAIVNELLVTLDRERGATVAAGMASLYAYCLERLLAANVEKDASHLTEVAATLSGLRDAWQQACLAPLAAVAG